MPTFTAFTKTTGRLPAEAISDVLENLIPEPIGVGVFEIEDGSGLWEVGAYFTEAPDVVGLALIAAANGAKDFIISELPDTDWVAKVRRDLAPVEAGRFFVYGSHDADKLPDDKIGLLIEAAMAFGTGHHGTTLGCLRAFDRLLTSGASYADVADIGCGTAVLAMAAAKVNDTPAYASDIDEVAVAVAQSNVDANDLTSRVICLEAAGFNHEQLEANAPYDLVFANILKGPLVALAPDIAARTREGGAVILSGILNPQAAEVIEVYTRNGFNLMHHEQIVDWSTLTLEKIAAN
ncbi:50S ribosomal protein L11 methyltransferase [Pacificibacter marinus]|uniref:Ribosomal protein L11 methyltransferase n=1 Tax=Pacificibacter marinus TaxID=658057 RepID=A0A1Y5RGL0_9RHOB|nr:50S ribosomal protein L11 methyltransferase [Pacificibacter marinus]SEK19929.1 [LSU ribosomal protein L11P]-lysine N-methyltransferase [Pacificibacter marinus]SLN16948.1 Ribosomal protein L11 methyltransferase [Pacificibacter marinus]